MPPKKRQLQGPGSSDTAAKKVKVETTRRSTRSSAKGDTRAQDKTVNSKATGTAAKNTSKNTAPTKSKTLESEPESKQKGLKKSKPMDSSQNDAEKEPKELAEGLSFWLLKAEPESRIEKGKDVKFSIDDLAAVDKEPWDGVRNPSARNNMRAMKKGDKAFFYHSNCKVPGIAGIMTIADEHSVDESAFDPDHPYYDEKSSRENPKWFLVHVKFLKKLDNLIALKELQKYSQQGGQLANMQVLRMSRLSVSKVSKQEWDFVCRELAEIDPDTLETLK